jgi:tetratricopeptide (TPR) repeat protein
VVTHQGGIAMSAELNRARAQLSSTSTLLKQQKLLAAVMAVHDAVGGFLHLQPTLLKAERDDIQRLIERSVGLLNASPDMTKVSPLLLKYTPGAESNLLSHLRTILEELQDSAVQDAKAHLLEMERSRQQLLDNGLNQLEGGDARKAKRFFDQLLDQYGDDTELKVEISEAFLRRGEENLAWEYLEKADMDNPETVHLFNRMGKVLRRLQRYREAEANFLKAMEKAKDDEYLVFNLGRVYIDWQQWSMAVDAAEQALALNPHFKEAKQMLGYAQKQIEKLMQGG